ncbi:hypothetical protein [Stratiformator vulcanicus]|uniref:Uncharacterized protein n=1 Tax=Stratiformator vulcanicus TaxID=2527980 RepID=A0A517R6I8_9PLAN|nr:hypothetical protein [Stratiformator vulcanicus]QDT39517.1 hypothetical protein Pan189_39250 [Stratiformator vulcanicus]
MRPQLRIFTGDETDTLDQRQVSVPLEELADVLSEASRGNRTWVRDFAKDEIQVSPDLYEVLCAYRHLRPSA